MSWRDDLYYLRRAVDASKRAVETGNEPFGCLLVDPDGNILMEQANAVGDTGDATAHAEITLIRRAATAYDQDYLWQCILYTTMEPCCMCTGAAYWANLGHIKFAMTEKGLGECFGENSPTLDLPSREVIARGPKPIRVDGPFEEVVPEVQRVIRDWLASSSQEERKP
jgi:tRNA(Arg) A34 adenosine deaminase TadA